MSPAPNPLWSPVRWAENGAVRLAFDSLTEGAGGEPLLLATGLGVNRLWVPDGLCRMLAAQGFAVARYDQRDGGESTHLPPTPTRSPISALFGKRETAYTAEDMADDAVAVMSALGWRSAHLLGVSLGGAVAQRVALRHPDRVRTLTSMAAVPGDTSGLRTMRYIQMRTLAKFARLRFPDTPEGDVAAGIAVSVSSPRPTVPSTSRPPVRPPSATPTAVCTTSRHRAARSAPNGTDRRSAPSPGPRSSSTGRTTPSSSPAPAGRSPPGSATRGWSSCLKSATKSPTARGTASSAKSAGWPPFPINCPYSGATDGTPPSRGAMRPTEVPHGGLAALDCVGLRDGEIPAG